MDDRSKAALGLDRSRSEDGVQSEAGARVVWRALHPAAEAVDGAGDERQRGVARRDLRIEESTVTTGAAVRGKL